MGVDCALYIDKAGPGLSLPFRQIQDSLYVSILDHRLDRRTGRVDLFSNDDHDSLSRLATSPLQQAVVLESLF